MAALTIDRLALRYRIPVAQRDRERELERVREQVFGHALEAALAAANVGVHELVAVREVSVPVRISASLSTAAIVERWTSALSEAIATRIRQGDPREVARYRSRSAALVELGRAVARADLRRSWAWVTIGLVEADATADVASLRAGFVAALEREPRAIVAVLAELARTPSLLPRLAPTLSGAAWRGWARAALRAHSAPHELVERLWSALDASASASGSAARSLAVGGHVDRDMNEAIAGQAMVLGLARSASLAALEPELARQLASVSEAGESSRATTEIAALIVHAARRDPAVLARIVLAALAEDPASAWSRLSALARALERLPQTGSRGEGPSTTTGAPALERRDRASRALDRDVHEPLAEPGSQRALDERGIEVPPAIEPWSEIEPAREPASTPWGGLLLLLAIFPALDLWTELSALAERLELELRAIMRRFGELLIATEVAADDPGLLAFAGLPPDAELPPMVSPAELDDALGLARARIVEHLDERLGPLQARRGESLLRWLLARRARILTDPGWIELRFDLRDVDTAIRRAGLDLDPDWLPTLGVVVKFTYA